MIRITDIANKADLRIKRKSIKYMIQYQFM